MKVHCCCHARKLKKNPSIFKGELLLARPSTDHFLFFQEFLRPIFVLFAIRFFQEYLSLLSFSSFKNIYLTTHNDDFHSRIFMF